MVIDPQIRKELIAFLENIPPMGTEDGRRSLLLNAGLDPILKGLRTNVSVREFTPLLIEHLDKFGALPDQRTAIVHFLQEITNWIGTDHQKTIREFCERLENSSTTISDICPYRGLYPFIENDTEFFFGRQVFVSKLLKAVQTNSVVSVIGPSGIGKSSVVYAGLLPQLRKQGNWIVASFVPGSNPLENLADTLGEIVKNLQMGQYEVHQDARLLLRPKTAEADKFDRVKESLRSSKNDSLHLHEVIRQIQNLPGIQGYHIVIIADQFEEIYTLCCDKSIQRRFLQELFSIERLETQLLPQNFHVVLTLRADFIEKALLDPYFSRIIKDSSTGISHQYCTTLYLGSMDWLELRDVIEKPASKIGLIIENGLSEKILEAILREPGNLPLLEFTLTSLWFKRSGNVLTKSAYEEIGGVEKALARYAEKQYSELLPEEKVQAQRIFVQLTQLGEGTEDTRRRVQKQEIFTASQNDQ